jgi:hypothetical protein
VSPRRSRPRSSFRAHSDGFGQTMDAPCGRHGGRGARQSGRDRDRLTYNGGSYGVMMESRAEAMRRAPRISRSVSA